MLVRYCFILLRLLVTVVVSLPLSVVVRQFSVVRILYFPFFFRNRVVSVVTHDDSTRLISYLPVTHNQNSNGFFLVEKLNISFVHVESIKANVFSFFHNINTAHSMGSAMLIHVF